MGWESDDGMHEGYVLPEFADGVRGTGVSGGGTPADHVVVEVTYEGDPRDGTPTMKMRSRPAADVIGWRIVCACRRDPNSSRTTDEWVSELIARVPSPARTDIAAGRLYAADEEVVDVAYDDDNGDAFVERWRREHVNGQTALGAITAARDAAIAADRDLDAAVAAARAAGESWEGIGRAAGMARQSAHQRWGRQEPVLTTISCGRCGAAESGTAWSALTAWADEHTDTEHHDEARWPNTFTLRRSGDGPTAPPSVHYRWPFGWDPTDALTKALDTSGDIIDQLDPRQLRAFLVAGDQRARSTAAAASDARRAGNEPRADRYDQEHARMTTLLDHARKRLPS